MAYGSQEASTGDCSICPYKRGMVNQKWIGVRIPDGPGKCIRPDGLCRRKLEIVKGPESVQAAPADGALESTVESEAAWWVLRCSVSDINWKLASDRLTDEEIMYCLARETRSSGQVALTALAKRRGLLKDDDGREDEMARRTDVLVMDEVYDAGKRQGDRAIAELESERIDCEALGKIKAAHFNIKTNELLKYVTLYHVKRNKEHRKAGRTWEDFCRAIGESDRSVDRILSELTPLLEKISANQAEILGMPLSKIRYLGRSLSANLAEITDNAILIGDQRIEIIPENKDDIEAAIDEMKESQEKERAAHEKEVEKLKKKVESAVTEETRGLKVERDALVKEVERLKVFDPAEKDVEWSVEMMHALHKQAAEFVCDCGRFVLDKRLDGEIELQAQVEGIMRSVEMGFRDLVKLWDERFNHQFGD